MMPTKTLLFIFVLAIGQLLQAQDYHVFRQKKMYVGLTGGINFGGAQVVKDYHVLVNTPQSSATGQEKKYASIGQNKGSQFGLYFSYSFTRKLSFVFEPSFQTTSFNYATAYSWSDTVNSSDFNIEMMHRQKLSGVNLPLLARYDFTASQFSPYVQGGIFMSFGHHARKTIFYDNTIDDEVDKETAGQTGEADLTRHMNRANVGLSAGAGFTWFANYFAISLESNFRYGFRSMVNDQNRYADYTGFSVQYLDAMDQLKLFNLDIQLSIMFPIDNSVSLGILRKSRY